MRHSNSCHLPCSSEWDFSYKCAIGFVRIDCICEKLVQQRNVIDITSILLSDLSPVENISCVCLLATTTTTTQDPPSEKEATFYLHNKAISEQKLCCVCVIITVNCENSHNWLRFELAAHKQNKKIKQNPEICNKTWWNKFQVEHNFYKERCKNFLL